MIYYTAQRSDDTNPEHDARGLHFGDWQAIFFKRTEYFHI